MTDWGTTSRTLNAEKNMASDPGLCIAAGNDLIMPGSKDDVEGVLIGLRSGKVTRAELETCAGRIADMCLEISGS